MFKIRSISQTRRAVPCDVPCGGVNPSGPCMLAQPPTFFLLPLPLTLAPPGSLAIISPVPQPADGRAAQRSHMSCTKGLVGKWQESHHGDAGMESWESAQAMPHMQTRTGKAMVAQQTCGGSHHDALPADRGNAICTWWSLVKAGGGRRFFFSWGGGGLPIFIGIFVFFSPTKHARPCCYPRRYLGTQVGSTYVECGYFTIGGPAILPSVVP